MTQNKPTHDANTGEALLDYRRSATRRRDRAMTRLRRLWREWWPGAFVFLVLVVLFVIALSMIRPLP